MPNRILKEGITTSDTIDDMSWFEECFFYRLIVNCDDYGRFDARPAVLKARLFPLKDRLTLKDVESALKKLTDIGCVNLYEYDGKPYLYLTAWSLHQRVRDSKEKYPSPDSDGSRRVAASCGEMRRDFAVIQSNPNPNPNPNPKERTRFTPPTVEEVKAYCKERKNSVDAETFVDFYASKGWKVGNTPMKDWQSAVRTWEKRETFPQRGKPKSKALDYLQRDEKPDTSFVIDLYGGD